MRSINDKNQQLVKIIGTNIQSVNRYGKIPLLYLYSEIFENRKRNSLDTFLSNENTIRLLYTILVMWDINHKSLRIKQFCDFREAILICMISRAAELKELEDAEKKILTKKIYNPQNIKSALYMVYNKLQIMQNGTSLISNSKLLHLLFPDLLMPIQKDTLSFYFGNTTESFNKYWEIINHSIALIAKKPLWKNLLDENWNKSLPKLIDNAIIINGMKEEIPF